MATPSKATADAANLAAANPAKAEAAAAESAEATEVHTAKAAESPGRPRRTGPAREFLGLHHFAFYRGYLEGLAIDRLASQYLETGLDLRRAKTTLMWIRDRLVAGARLERRGAAARLLAIDRARIDASDAAIGVQPLPTLEEYAEERDPGQFYTQEELTALFEQEFAGRVDRRRERNDRLRTKQVRALAQLQELLSVKPRSHHHVAGWFHPAIALRLESASIWSLGDLVHVITQRGKRWHAKVARLGPETARRIEQWLERNGGALEARVPSGALVPRRMADPIALKSLRPPAMAVAPLEYLVVPPHLDGAAGANRLEVSAATRTGARTDLAAIHAWLGTLQPPGGHTWKSYRTNAERFLLWALFERNKALSDLNVEDCTAYRAFLFNPQPAAKWVGRRGVGRYRADWRPFDGALSPSSAAHAMTVLKRMCNWLVDAQYLRYNPFNLIPKIPVPGRGKLKTSRSFSDDTWTYLKSFAAGLPDEDARTHRIRFLLRFAYATGMRLSEIARATVGDLTQQDLADLKNVWTLNVVGKGAREREIHLPRQIVEAMRAYFEQRGLGRDFGRLHARTPIIGRTREDMGASAMTAGGLSHVLTEFFGRAAAALAHSDPHGAARLGKASAHWLRHTFGTHAVARGVAIDLVKDQLGHSSLATTTVYIHAEDARRAREIEKAFENAF